MLGMYITGLEWSIGNPRLLRPHGGLSNGRLQLHRRDVADLQDGRCSARRRRSPGRVAEYGGCSEGSRRSRLPRPLPRSAFSSAGSAFPKSCSLAPLPLTFRGDRGASHLHAVTPAGEGRRLRDGAFRGHCVPFRPRIRGNWPNSFYPTLCPTGSRSTTPQRLPRACSSSSSARCSSFRSSSPIRCWPITVFRGKATDLTYD